MFDLKEDPTFLYARRETSVLEAAATAVLIGVIVAALVFGRPFLLPLAVACLCAFALGPLVTRLRRWLPISVSVALAVMVGVAAVALLGSFISVQLVDLAASLSAYRQNLHDKITTIREMTQGGGALSQFMSLLAGLAAEITEGRAAAAASATIPMVRVQAPPGTTFETVARVAESIASPAITAGMVLVLVIFMLLERDRVRDLFVAICGNGDVHGTTVAITDASERVSRYLALQLLTNAMFAAVVSLGLYLLGLPNPLLWGLLGGALRFIPYVGAVLGALLPTLVALAVSTGWQVPLLVLGMIVVIDIVLGQMIEPLLFGLHTGVSPLALLVSAIFWGIVWGPVGLVLATPLTVCLAVLGRHARPLRFLDTILSGRPGLPPHLQIYQRLLAGSSVGAAEVAAACETKHGVDGLEDLLGRMIAHAERDRLKERLKPADVANLVDGIEEIVAQSTADEERAGDATPAYKSPGRWVMCVGGRGRLDTAAAALMDFALSRRGLNTGGPAPNEGGGSPDLHVVCYASKPTSAVMRYTARKHLAARAVIHGVVDYDAPERTQDAALLQGDVAALCDLIAARLTAQEQTPCDNDASSAAGA